MKEMMSNYGLHDIVGNFDPTTMSMSMSMSISYHVINSNKKIN